MPSFTVQIQPQRPTTSSEMFFLVSRWHQPTDVQLHVSFTSLSLSVRTSTSPCPGGIYSLHTDGSTVNVPTVLRSMYRWIYYLCTDGSIIYVPTVTRFMYQRIYYLCTDYSTVNVPTDLQSNSLYLHRETRLLGCLRGPQSYMRRKPSRPNYEKLIGAA